MLNLSQYRIILIAISALLLLAGCSPNKSKNNKSYKDDMPTTPLHTAIIKVERESGWTGFGNDFEVYDNNKKVGTLKDGRTVSWIRPPGNIIIKIDKIEDLPSVIHDSLFSFKFSNEELSFLMEAIERNHILVNYWGIMREFIQLDSVLIHSDVKKTILEFEKVFENYDEDFSIMTSAYHKII